MNPPETSALTLDLVNRLGKRLWMELKESGVQADFAVILVEADGTYRFFHSAEPEQWGELLRDISSGIEAGNYQLEGKFSTGNDS